MSDRSGAARPARVLAAAALLAVALGGCGDALQGDRPSEVRVQRVITPGGERIVSYTAMFDDGIETYVDRHPQGDVDLITVERDGRDAVRLVREGAAVSLPADGPEASALDESWQRRFEAIDALVDVDRVPWSDAHGGLTPEALRVAPLQPAGGS